MTTDVIGDPGAMRAVAAGLRMRADQLLDVACRIESTAEAAAYEGPAADRLRAATADRRQRLASAAWHLQELADALSRGAADVAEAQAELRRTQAEEEY
jgi:hypothetical protein